MSILGIDILTFLILGPIGGAALLALLPNNAWLARITALGIASLFGIIAGLVFFEYVSLAPTSEEAFLFVAEYRWFTLLDATWHVGLDGISASMMLLTGLLTPLAVLIAWEVSDRPNFHMALLLLFEAGSMGVFLALDLMIFFLFYELSLVPMYFLINQWGSKGGREYASTKFMIYSIGGTLGMLLATQLIGFTTGTYEIAAIVELWPNFSPEGGAFLGASIGLVKGLAFAGFMVAFAIKVPIWPFHTWLPDAHGEAPTAGSMLLAGVMLKLGAYGFIRLVVPFFPDVWISNVPLIGVNVATLFAFLSMLGIVLGALAAFGQNDIKRLVAYSSVNHMGFVGLGIAVMALLYGEAWAGANGTASATGTSMMDAITATNGTVLQMFNHGLSSAGMFLLAGGIYHKTHTRDLTQYGGFFVKAPIFGGLFIFMSMSSLGLPGLNGFVGEFLIVRGSWPVFTWLTVLSMIGLLFTGSYILKGIRATLHGPFNMHWKDTNLEIERREFIAVFVLGIFILLTGLYPDWILGTINASVVTLLELSGMGIG